MQEKEGDKKDVSESRFVKWFSELNNKNIDIAGGKGASLAEMYNSKFPVPPGFVITAQAYAYFLEKAGLSQKIKSLLDDLNVEDTKKLEEVSKKIKEVVANSSMPDEMEKEIIESYEILDANKINLGDMRKGALDILKNSKETPFVAVRSSATTEDLVDASFAGQQDSFLNIKGNKELIESVKKCFASLFTARAIYYRVKKGFAHDKSLLAVVVQRMIDSDKSGVMFSRNPVSEEDRIVVEAVWGLGEGIVSGMIKPDHYEVSQDIAEFKVTKLEVAEKKSAIVRNSSGQNTIVKLTEERSKQQVLNNYEIKLLSQYAKNLEEHYSKPQDIEFAIEGKEIYIVQSRPITTLFSAEKRKDLSGNILLSGLGASPGIASGPVKIIKDLTELNKIKTGDVLVTFMTNPDMVVSMQKAAAIVTDEGGITSHASIVSREMGIPAVVGTGNATSVLEEGKIVTVDGFTGKVYEGKGETKTITINPIVKTRTKIKVILDLPDFSERAALSGAKSVGLVRLEGIIASSGKHPLYFSQNKKFDEYIKILFSGLKKISEHFEEVWIRTSDIRSDEYQHLQGAPKEVEGNPMLGDHGIRFSLKHKEILKAEIESISNLAKEFPNKKFGIMIPQVISASEFTETRSIAGKIGISENLKLGIMIETPAAIQIINQLCEAGIQFVSFGTNDLTQYMLAIDRNNKDVQHLYDETNPAVLSAISYAIRRCKKSGVETSICGQAGSREEMVRFLLSEGIDSISVNADAAEKVSKLVYEVETGKSPASNKNPESETPKIESTNKDIEEAILKELDDDHTENHEDYVPGDTNESKEKEGIPSLNDTIPIEEVFNPQKNN